MIGWIGLIDGAVFSILLSRNRSNFGQIAGLRLEDWS
jgi:hypothetical protein